MPRQLARTCVLNGLAAARSAIGSLDRITRVVKVVGFVASDPSFTGQPGVINGASELLAEIFGESRASTRAAWWALPCYRWTRRVEVEFAFEFA